MSRLSLAHIRMALGRPLPGQAAQLTMAPQPRAMRPPPGVEPRRAAVLLLLYPRDKVLHIVLTVRSAGLNHHGGQVSFPGGGWEEGDASLQETALREACEELGVCREIVEVLGPLTPLYVPPSNNLVHPYVAYTPERPNFCPDANEVAQLLEIPLPHFFDPQVRRVERWARNGVPLDVPFFAFAEVKIWGATAIMLAEFLAAITAPLEDSYVL